MINLKEKLDAAYLEYNQRKYIDPDPLLFLYDYPEKKDIEIAGFIAACFAYGKVNQIMKTVGHILGTINPSPFEYLMTRTKKDIAEDFKGFCYRFADESHLTDLLWGIRNVLRLFSSLENCLCEKWSYKDDTLIPGLTFLYDQIQKNQAPGHLMADPGKKSACKRSHLFLRWMVRNDAVDPGIWETPSPCQLIIPLDTHMYRTGILLGFTERKTQDIKTALEITQGFRKILREDPVKYDFCLTRFGIRKELNIKQLNLGSASLTSL